jgi:hypothetical protein
MSSSSGIGGGSQFVIDQNSVTLSGQTGGSQTIDLGAPGALAALEAALGESGQAILAQIKAQMQARGMVLDANSGRFVPSDTYRRGTATTSSTQTESAGQASADTAMNDIADAMRNGGVYVNPRAAMQTYQNIRSSDRFAEDVAFVKNSINNPAVQLGLQSTPPKGAGQAFLQELAARGLMHRDEDPALVVMALMRESVKESFEDTKVFLDKIKHLNNVSTALTETAAKIDAISKKMANAEGANKYPEKATIEISNTDSATRIPDLSSAINGGTTNAAQLRSLDWGGQVNGNSTILRRGHIDAMAKNIEREMEKVRNERQMATTHFQNFDQKKSQYISILTNVSKNWHSTVQSAQKNFL